jgi:hypothetical protein
MHGRPARDRLAVWTYAEHGEEIPCGDPSVTDAERAAPRRETLTERRQAVLPGNQSRATPGPGRVFSPARKCRPAHAQKFHPLCTFG